MRLGLKSYCNVTFVYSDWVVYVVLSSEVQEEGRGGQGSGGSSEGGGTSPLLDSLSFESGSSFSLDKGSLAGGWGDSV